MPTGLYCVLKFYQYSLDNNPEECSSFYFSFTFNIHLTQSDTHISRHNLFSSVNDIITEFDCVCNLNLKQIHKNKKEEMCNQKSMQE
jgi:hypothetical protein